MQSGVDLSFHQRLRLFAESQDAPLPTLRLRNEKGVVNKKYEL
jgi:hypothetical protein